MKCPKCNYLGFDTGDRCKNCGYDFSLVPVDLDLNEPDGHLRSSIGDLVIDRSNDASPYSTPDRVADRLPNRQSKIEDGLPLFSPAGLDDDLPLVKLPAAPRPPLAVRRTPDQPRPRGVPKPSRPQPEPVLQFLEDHLATRGADSRDQPRTGSRHKNAGSGGDGMTRPGLRTDGKLEPSPGHERSLHGTPVLLPSGAVRRLLAAVIDHAILAAIDAGVIYFTLSMAALSISDWAALPPVPLVAFLALLKLGYFSAFTAVGGQTIGKMAAGIRVITDDNRSLNPTCALRRTLAGVLSCVTLGVGFLPALVRADRRALHDRVAHTRVVTLPS
jgi:uncharacterized RDD family membrane protein YckC